MTAHEIEAPDLLRIQRNITKIRSFGNDDPVRDDLNGLVSDLAEMFEYARKLEIALARERNSHEMTKIRERRFRDVAHDAVGAL